VFELMAGEDQDPVEAFLAQRSDPKHEYFM